MKTTKAMVLARVEKVLELRLNGAELHDIRAYAASPEEGEAWNIGERQLRRYLRQAERLAERLIEKKASVTLTRHLLQRHRLYALALEAGDYRTALAVLHDEAELAGLYPPKTLKHTGGEKAIGMDMTTAGKPIVETSCPIAPEAFAAFMDDVERIRGKAVPAEYRNGQAAEPRAGV